MSYRLKRHQLAYCIALILGIGTLAIPIGFAAPAVTTDKLNTNPTDVYSVVWLCD